MKLITVSLEYKDRKGTQYNISFEIMRIRLNRIRIWYKLEICGNDFVSCVYNNVEHINYQN
jgi:hypothetical protein